MVKAGDPGMNEQVLETDVIYREFGFSKHSDNRSVCSGRKLQKKDMFVDKEN